ncbi:MAG: O-antigen ligase family protein [Candidatus Omnitrophota bacterium]|nr:O-antigen ligase family protein [Candidatus Omnitrophota bacterium]
MNKNKGQGGLPLILFFISLAVVFPLIFFGLPAERSYLLILGVVIFVISFVNSNLALGILILSMLLSPEFRAGGVRGRAIVVRADDVLLLVIFLGWMARAAISKGKSIFRHTTLNLPLFLYIMVCFLASGQGILDGLVKPQEAFFYILKYLEYYLLYFMVVNNLKSYKQSKTFVYAMLFTSFLVCLIAWRQSPITDRFSTPFEEGGGEPNTLAGYLLLMMSLTLAFICTLKSTNKKILLFGLFALSFVCFVRTLSRGGWVAFFPMFLALTIFSRRYKLPLLVLLISGVIIIPQVVPRIVRDRIEQAFAPEVRVRVMDKDMIISESAAARINTWRNALKIMTYRPLLGQGVPASAVVDNQFARVLSETGLIGLSIFIWMIVLIFQACFRAYRFLREDDFSEGLALGLICGLVGLLTMSFSSATFILIRIMEPFWFLVAIIVMLPELVQEQKLQES